MTVEQRVRTFLLESTSWSGPSRLLTDHFALIENDVLDSVGIMQLVTWLESAFEIQIPDEELAPENFESIAAIARLVEASSA